MKEVGETSKKDVDELFEEFEKLEDELDVQDDDTYQPSCFSKSVFSDSNFDMDSFISDFTKRQLPLTSVNFFFSLFLNKL